MSSAREKRSWYTRSGRLVRRLRRRGPSPIHRFSSGCGWADISKCPVHGGQADPSQSDDSEGGVG